MGCFCWFSSNEKSVDRRRNGARRTAQQPAYPPRNDHNHIAPQPKNRKPRPPPESNDNKDARDHKEAASGSGHVMAAQTFTFRELAMATKNFRRECLIGEGGFGRVYKGKLDKSGQVVAVKQLNRNGLQGNREFLVELAFVCVLCCIMRCHNSLDMSRFSDLTPEQKPLEWFSRMKIALGAAKGLEYLHDKANPPVIYRDMKSSNILLDKFFNAKLSDFGLAKLGPVGDKLHVSSRSSSLNISASKTMSQAQPVFKEPSRYPELADPLLQGGFPVRGLNQAVAVAAMCLQEEPLVRPLICDVVSALISLLGDGLEEGAEPAASFPSPPTTENPDSAKERQLAVERSHRMGVKFQAHGVAGSKFYCLVDVSYVWILFCFEKTSLFFMQYSNMHLQSKHNNLKMGLFNLISSNDLINMSVAFFYSLRPKACLSSWD
ncbi:hypothetical protein OIU78_011061 [Salix suchowensis]|nr:hypothetical protein OIU78_011061 [Salix suchowensis]